MITLDFGGGKRVTLREFSRYNPRFDSQGVRLSVWYQGEEYWVESPVEPGKSLREAREKGTKALEAAVRAGTPGEVFLDGRDKTSPVEVAYEMPVIPPVTDTTLHLKRGPGRPRKE